MTDYILNKYRFKKLKDMYLLTVDDGSWLLIYNDEFKNLQNNIINNETKKLFEQEGIIITKSNELEIIKRIKQKYSFLNNGPSLHIVVTTLRCNMNCVYCQASSKKTDSNQYDMDQETAKKTVDLIFQTPSKYITIEFQGGEPLMNFEIIKFISEYAQEINKKHKKELSMTVVTNLSLMDDIKLKYLIENQIAICTSFDGPREIHNYNRPVHNSDNYDHIVKWTKEINQEYQKNKINQKINALITITKPSLNQHKEIIDEYVKLGYENIHLRFLTNLGCANKMWSKIGYTPEEFIDFWKKAMDYIIELNKKGTIISERLSTIILKKILNSNNQVDYLDLRSPCGAVIGQMLYNYDGNIYTCDEGRMVDSETFKIGDVNNTYSEIMKSTKTCDIVTASINDSYICDDCVYKPYCGICPVCNFFEEGSVISKIPENSRCKIYKAIFDYIFEKYLFDQEVKEIFDVWLKQ
jgi:uncharacterized protein